MTRFYADPADNCIWGANSAYATARSTAAASNQGQNYLWVGQRLGSGIYYVYRSFLAFDTSAIPDGDTVTAATLGLKHSPYKHNYATFSLFLYTYDFKDVPTGSGTGDDRDDVFDMDTAGSLSSTAAVKVGGAVTAVLAAPTAGGTGYTLNDVLTLSTGNADATVTATGVTAGVVTEVTLTAGGTGYDTGAGQGVTGGSGNDDCTVNVSRTSTEMHGSDVTLGAFSELSVIDPTLVIKDGVTYFALKSSEDVANSAPGAGVEEYFQLMSTDSSGTSSDPYLDVTHGSAGVVRVSRIYSTGVIVDSPMMQMLPRRRSRRKLWALGPPIATAVGAQGAGPGKVWRTVRRGPPPPILLPTRWPGATPGHSAPRVAPGAPPGVSPAQREAPGGG